MNLRPFLKGLERLQSAIQGFFIPSVEKGARKYTAFIYATLLLHLVAGYLLWVAKIDAETWAAVVVPIQTALVYGFFAANSLTHFGKVEPGNSLEEVPEEQPACGECGRLLDTEENGDL